MNLLPIAQHLEDDGIGTMAVDIFINALPVDSQQSVLLRNKLSGTVIDYELPGYYKTRFQVIVRSTNVPIGTAKMAEIFASLKIEETEIDTMFVRYCRPVTMPVTFPLSKGNLLETSVDFEIAYFDSDAI